MFPAEGFQPTLLKLVEILDRLRIRFHLTGAIASIVYGEPRLTQDLDLVLDRERVIDLYVRCLIPGELDRSVPTELFPGVSLPVVARTDAALSKLIWIDHGSHRSRRDLRWILAAATSAESATVRSGAVELGLAAILDEVLAEKDEIDA